MRRISSIGLLIAVVACSGGARPSLGELREQEAVDIAPTMSSWDCRDDSFDMTHIGRDAWQEHEAIEAANEGLELAGHEPSLAQGQRVGAVWWLADRGGTVIAALSISGGLSVCFVP